MQASRNYSVQNPCTENWDAMTPQGEGKRFCDICQKCVFDLTGKSQTQIGKIYKENEGNLCGRFGADENPKPSAWTRFRQHYLSRAQVFLLALLLSTGLLSGCDISRGLPPYDDVMGDIGYHEPISDGAIRGNVTLPGGAPAAHVSLAVYQYGSAVQRTTTDKNGAYVFKGLAEGSYQIQVDLKNYNFQDLPAEVRYGSTLIYPIALRYARKTPFMGQVIAPLQ